MSSRHLRLFVKCSDSEKHKLLGSLLKELFKLGHHDLEKQRPKIVKLVTNISPTKGKKTWDAFESQLVEATSDLLIFDGVDRKTGRKVHRAKLGGYWVIDMLPGGDVESVFNAITIFFGELSAKTDVRGYSSNSEDSRDTFYRYTKGKLVVTEHTLFENLKEDDLAVKEIYAHWHKGLPKEIKVGALFTHVEDTNIVFAGKPGKVTLKNIEKAKKLGMVVQEKVSGKTDYFVICGPASKSLLASADKHFALLTSEAIFNWSLTTRY